MASRSVATSGCPYLLVCDKSEGGWVVVCDAYIIIITYIIIPYRNAGHELSVVVCTYLSTWLLVRYIIIYKMCTHVIYGAPYQVVCAVVCIVVLLSPQLQIIWWQYNNNIPTWLRVVVLHFSSPQVVAARRVWHCCDCARTLHYRTIVWFTAAKI